MHELPIALSMIEQIEEETAKRGGGTVETVYVRVGVLSGVDAQALRFAYELACEGTELAGSHLKIEAVPLLVYCPQCSSTHAARPPNIACSIQKRKDQRDRIGESACRRSFLLAMLLSEIGCLSECPTNYRKLMILRRLKIAGPRIG